MMIIGRRKGGVSRRRIMIMTWWRRAFALMFRGDLVSRFDDDPPPLLRRCPGLR